MQDRGGHNFLCGFDLDRRAEVRGEPDWHARALADSATQYLLSRGTAQLLRIESDPAIAFLSADHPLVATAPPERLVLLGWFRDKCTVLVELKETGVAVRDIRYHSSQPWPFPASIMIGFVATASLDAAIQIGAELEDARWFTRQELESGQVPFPPSGAISHRLIKDWLDNDTARPGGAGARCDASVRRQVT